MRQVIGRNLVVLFLKRHCETKAGGVSTLYCAIQRAGLSHHLLQQVLHEERQVLRVLWDLGFVVRHFVLILNMTISLKRNGHI